MTRDWRSALPYYPLLPLGALIALVWANTAGDSYFRVAQTLAFPVNEVGVAFGLASLAQEVVDVLGQLAREGTTMVMATHDLRLASKIAQEVVFLDAGAIVEKGPASVVFDNPERERTKRFIASLRQEEAQNEGGGA